MHGVGPVVVTWLIAGSGSRRPAFNIATLGWALCGALNLAACASIERDMRRVRLAADAKAGEDPKGHRDDAAAEAEAEAGAEARAEARAEAGAGAGAGDGTGARVRAALPAPSAPRWP